MPVQPGVVTTTAIAGGIIGTVAAGVLEYDTMTTLGFLPMVVVGFVEEGAKLIVPLAVLLLWRPSDPQGGVVVGIASGMGFATLETMGYGFQSLLAAGNVAAVDQTLLLRALLSPAGHIAWTGTAVAMLWCIPGARRRGRAVMAFLGVFLAAVSLVSLLVFVQLAHRAPRGARLRADAVA